MKDHSEATPVRGESIASASSAVVNSGHMLTQVLFASLSPVDQAKWSAFESAGAECALTVRWLEERVELRLGFTFGSSEAPITLLAIDTQRNLDSLTRH